MRFWVRCFSDNLWWVKMTFTPWFVNVCGTRKSLLLAELSDLYNKTCIVIWSSSDWLNRSFAGSHWQPKEVIVNLAEVIRKVTRARLCFKKETEIVLHFRWNNSISINCEQNHFSSACFKTWLWTWRLLGMSKAEFRVQENQLDDRR